MNRSLDRSKRSQFLRSLTGMKTVPEIAADPDNARQAPRKIAESNGLDQIVKTAEHGANLRESGLLTRHGDHQKDGRRRQRSVHALRVDRHPVPTFAWHFRILRFLW